MTARKPVPLVLPKSRTPIYAELVREHGWDPCDGRERWDRIVAHVREIRAGER